MKRILVIGRAEGTWQEVDAANELVCSQFGPFDHVVAVNDAGHDYEHVDHWVSFHGDRFEQWREIRKRKGFAPVTALWTSTYGRKESEYEKSLGRQGVKRVLYTGGGSSGMVAILVALIHLHGTHVILAGIPMDPERGHYNLAGPWKEAVRQRAAWKCQLPHFRPNVRSMSGWTMQELGKPGKEWLLENHQPTSWSLT